LWANTNIIQQKKSIICRS